MFEILNLTESKSARGAALWKFDVRFTLAGNLGSTTSYAWRYDPANNKLFRPSAPGSYARMAGASDEVTTAIKRTVHRQIVYSQGDIDIATIATKLREVLSQATPREAYESLKPESDEDLTPNQWVIIMTLGVLSDYLNLLPEPNPEIPMGDND